ncbi:MAG: hypothetical protein JSS87_06545 [Acidobacteria bacterium]|nr:hypothetical protein [Acidobacteriota bacterium]
MILRTIIAALSLLMAVPALHAQDSDYPGATDFRTVQRPAKSFIIGAMHIDNDEYVIPIGTVANSATHPGKSIKVTGPIDALAYAGSKTTSTLSAYGFLSSQLIKAGYTQVWACARATCGSAFALAQILDQPLIDSIHEGSWPNWMINDLNAINEDIRYGVFRKGGEYMLVLTSLSPGYPSGVLLVRVNGPANEPVLPANANDQ